MESFDLRDLRAVLALLETGGFAGAAEEMGISQPAVSARIAKLEQTFGFPIFYRRPEGVSLTMQGEALISNIAEIDSEFSGLLQRASYWKRAQGSFVRILEDGSMLSQNLRLGMKKGELESVTEHWMKFGSAADWTKRLSSYDVDIVLAGSFLWDGGKVGITTVPLLSERGVTVVWNPVFHAFGDTDFIFQKAVSSTVILPFEAIAMGFREFISSWCKTAYGITFSETIYAHSEADAIDACMHGVGILLLPGDAETRLGLRVRGLESSHLFENVLPNAFVYGVRYRSEERNPKILGIVERFGRNPLGQG